jgi:hypothetical protein
MQNASLSMLQLLTFYLFVFRGDFVFAAKVASLRDLN